MKINYKDILETLVKGCQNFMHYNNIVDAYIEGQKRADKAFSAKDESAVRDLFEEAKADYRNFDLVQSFLTSQLLKDAVTKEFFLLDTKSLVLERVDEVTTEQMFDAKAYKNFRAINMKNIKTAYNPQSKEMFFSSGDSRFDFANIYRPAPWNMDYFYDKVPVPKVTKLPDLYEKFLRNLVTTEESYQYCLTFLATAVQPSPRMLPFLTMIGTQGTGKGLFGQIAAKLAGEANYAEIKCTDIQSTMKFNSSMENKRIIFLDELHVKNADDQNALKVLINDRLEIEKKGVDRKDYINQASCLVASNLLGAISPEATDRRFSFLDMKNRSIKDFLSDEYPNMKSLNEYAKLLTEDKNIQELGRFLWNYKILDHRLTNVLESEYSKKLKAEALKTWEQTLLDELCPKHAGETIVWSEVKSQLIDLVNNSSVKNLTVNHFRDLEGKHPGFFSVKRKKKDGKHLFNLVFNKSADQPVLQFEGVDNEE
jgi:hypothetical protein